MLRRTTASVLTVTPDTLLLCPADRTPPSRFAPQPHLAARAEVGRAAGDDDPHHLALARRAGLALAGVDEEPLLHRALLAAAVAVVVDRGAAGVDRRFERRDD